MARGVRKIEQTRSGSFALRARGGMLVVGLAACLAFSLARPAGAGTVLVYEDGPPPQGSRTTLSFQGNKLRVELGPPGHLRAILFRLTAVRGAESAKFSVISSTVMIDEETRTYIEVLAATTANPSPSSATGDARPEPASPTYTPVAKNVRVGRFSADHYEVSAAGRKAMDLWIADAAQLGIDPADTSSLSEVRKRYASTPRPSILAYLAAANAPAGVPVKAVLYDQGQASSVELVSVLQRELPDATFDVPAGYKRVEAPAPPPAAPPPAAPPRASPPQGAAPPSGAPPGAIPPSGSPPGGKPNR